MFIVNSYWFVPSTSYLLDTYTAAAAYSLRQLKTGVTSVVRVRRSSDNAESDFTADEITDGTLATWTGANDGFVTVWYDQAGSNNLSNSTASQQWQLVSSGVVITENGLPAIDSYPSATAKGIYVFNSGITGTEFTLFNVHRVTVQNTINYYLMSSGTSGYFFNGSFAGINGLGGFDGTNTRSGTGEDLTQHLFYTSVRSSTMYTSLDGAAESNLGTFNPFTLSYLGGRSGSFPNLQAWSKFQEVIIFNTDESANRAAIELDINGHYSIY